MLDVSRYFFTPEFLERFIDMMALYKLNILHLHLTDDQGWRIEIKKYPLLTEIGSFRGEGEERSGGFDTQDEMRDIVAYGKARGVEIVPEMVFPDHVMSAIVAYTELS